MKRWEYAVLYARPSVCLLDEANELGAMGYELVGTLPPDDEYCSRLIFKRAFGSKKISPQDALREMMDQHETWP